jgi:hypothetical protein
MAVDVLEARKPPHQVICTFVKVEVPSCRLVHKKGSERDPKYYKGIAVICTIGRIYYKVPRNLTEKETDTKQAEEQSGLRAGRTFTLKTEIEKQIQQGRETRGINRHRKST